MCAIKIVA